MLKSEFYDFILPFVPGVETPLVNFAIQRAVRTIAEQTGLLRTFIDVPVVPTQSVYLLPLPPETELTSIFVVRWFVDNTNVRIYPVTDNIAEYMTTLPSAAPTAWRQTRPDEIQLYPVPNEGGVIRVDALLRPTFVIEGEVPDIFTHYREMVANGALALLYGSPGKPWTSEKAAEAVYKNFAKSVLALRVYLRSGGMPNNATMKPVQTFGEQSADYSGAMQ